MKARFIFLVGLSSLFCLSSCVTTSSDAARLAATREMQGITFQVTSTSKQVTITPSGLSQDNRPVSAELKGIVKKRRSGRHQCGRLTGDLRLYS